MITSIILIYWAATIFFFLYLSVRQTRRLIPIQKRVLLKEGSWGWATKEILRELIRPDILLAVLIFLPAVFIVDIFIFIFHKHKRDETWIGIVASKDPKYQKSGGVMFFQGKFLVADDDEVKVVDGNFLMKRSRFDFYQILDGMDEILRPSLRMNSDLITFRSFGEGNTPIFTKMPNDIRLGVKKAYETFQKNAEGNSLVWIRFLDHISKTSKNPKVSCWAIKECWAIRNYFDFILHRLQCYH